MKLTELHLTNYRSFAQETIYFQDNLSILVGGNNGGKSNIIDAIRLISNPLNGRRDLYCEPTDIRFDSPEQSFEISAKFSPLSPPQQGRLLAAATDETLETAHFGITYDTRGKRGHVRPTLWAGRFKAQPEPGSHEMIRHVYLPPLRDAKLALASGNPTRIYALLNHFLEDRSPEEIASNLARPATDPILRDIDNAVMAGLTVLTTGVRPQATALDFNSDEKLIDIARDLRFKLSDHGVDPEDLRYSGHGLANLLYMATIAVELEKTDNAELTIFLVEEPEAHLHPQLQAAVLGFLQEQAEKSRPDMGAHQGPSEADNASISATDGSAASAQDVANSGAATQSPAGHAPAGHVQIIVATHSPNLSAWVPNENIVFVRSVTPAPSVPPVPGEEDAAAPVPAPRRHSRGIPLAKLELGPSERRKIDRYLDVTKSAFLFGGRVLLVEGIAEALLFPIFAKRFVLTDQPDRLRAFRSAVFVPIDGVDFEPYVKALLTPFNGIRIADQVVVVTDGDKTTVEAGKPLPGMERKSKLDAVAHAAAASSALAVFVNTYSFESELVAAGNAEIMKNAYLALHPRSEEKWDDAIAKSGDEQAVAIHDLFGNTGKGDYAQVLAEKIATAHSFNVPDYVRDAILAIAS